MSDSRKATEVWKSALPTMIKNCLLNAGIETIEQARNAIDVELLRLPNFGRGSLETLRRLTHAGQFEVKEEQSRLIAALVVAAKSARDAFNNTDVPYLQIAARKALEEAQQACIDLAGKINVEV